ncbi:MAG: hypothetical protein GY795_41265 [Desulfobacterales bacterium]|nr:hypothetical protein [Desulfobacterales bacterium]
MKTLRQIIIRIKQALFYLCSLILVGPKGMLAETGLHPYPRETELAKVNDNLNVIPLSQQDINEDFNNLTDLNWLEPIAKGKKGLFIAENHYFRYSWNLRSRIFFALNRFDYYPLIIMEDQYSKTPYVQHYLEIENDQSADKFFAENLHDFITIQEEQTLLRHIRRWDKKYPDNPLKVAYTDIEFNFRPTILKILFPYFEKLKNPDVAKMKKHAESENIPDMLETMKTLAQKAKDENLAGDFLFVTPEYIENTVTNLQAYYDYWLYDSDYFRQKAIIRNLTQTSFPGDFLINNKALICGGQYHFPTKFKYPGDSGFLCEGSFLTYDFAPLKGKTHSVLLHGIGYSPLEALSFNSGKCVQQGDMYIRIAGKMQQAYKQKLISIRGHYMLLPLDNLDRLIIRKAYQNNHNPLLLSDTNQYFFLEYAARHTGADYAAMIKKIEYFDRYDTRIFIPRSPMTKARKR